MNATRKYSEIDGEKRYYRPLGVAEIEAACVSSREAPFRPAAYAISSPRAINPGPPRASEVTEIVSMIGMYRDIAEPGEVLRAKGVLEEVAAPSGSWVRLVVGSGRPGEFVEWE